MCAMAEPLRRPGRPRGGGGGRRTRGFRAAGADVPGAQRSPARRTLDSVLVDLVSDSGDDVLEVATARDAAAAAEVPLPESPCRSRPGTTETVTAKGGPQGSWSPSGLGQAAAAAAAGSWGGTGGSSVLRVPGSREG